jgi:hypothetical protein
MLVARLMKRLGLFLLFIPLAILACGVFGALHDQISYSVSSEYFTKFKFRQFGLIDPAIPDRVRALEVGFLASWWMGISLGILCGSAGFIQRTPALMWSALNFSLLVAIGTTAVAAFAGLAYGWEQTREIDITTYRGWFVPPNVVNLRRFPCAGYMHNAAYFGGGFSIVMVWLLNIAFRRLGKSASDEDIP